MKVVRVLVVSIIVENFGRNSFIKVEEDDGGGFMVLMDYRVG